MNVFVPYKSPIDVARCLDKKRFNKQIIECHQIIDSIINNKGNNHPIFKMYTPYVKWLQFYTKSLEAYRDHIIDYAIIYSNTADTMIPKFLNDEFCISHRRRLYTKDKEFYKQFERYGESEANWYVVGNELWVYENGVKKVYKN